jgi:hypothetical protein
MVLGSAAILFLSAAVIAQGGALSYHPAPQGSAVGSWDMVTKTW